MKSKLIVICMFLLILFSVSAVSAEDLSNETQITQDVDDTVLADPSTGTFSDLQSQINSAPEHSTITLDKSYTGSSGVSIELSKSLTIDGQGNTLDCGNNKKCRAFTSDKGDITIKNLIIKNGKHGTGGAIFISGSAKYTIINCTFINNNADNGGAIYNNVERNELVITDSTFKGNYAGYCGGAVFSKGELTIENSAFESNKAKYFGGAINAEKLVDIVSSNFTSNEANTPDHQSFGGAIYANEEVYAQGSIFKSNFARSEGGAIYANKEAFFKKTNFTENSARVGGAIYKSESSYVVVDNTIFERNKATGGKGGAVYSTKIHVDNSTFFENEASGEGGAIWTEYIQFNDKVSFISNRAHDHGGAIYTGYMANEMKDLYFDSNIADGNYGGALYINNKFGDVMIFNSTFENNQAIRGDGGAIFCDSSMTTLHLIGCVFNRNDASGGTEKRDGGAVRSIGNIHVKNSTFTGNSAQNYGGAIFASQSVYVAENSKFIGNTARDGGGAIYAKTLNHIEDAVFINNNAAKGDGGAIYISEECVAYITTSYFDSNAAYSGKGGAIYFDHRDGNLYLLNNAFVYNTATGQGKDVFNKGYYKTITGNWWGTNSPSFNNEKLMEYKVIGSNQKHSDSSVNKISISADKNGNVSMNMTIKVSFSKNTAPYLFDIIELTSSRAGDFVGSKVVGNDLIVTYVPKEAGNHEIVAKVNSATVKCYLNVKYVSVYGNDLVKVYGDSKFYSAVFKDANGNYLPEGTIVNFEINGISSRNTVSENGTAIFSQITDIKEGTYTIKAINPVTNEVFTNKIVIQPKDYVYNIKDNFIIKFNDLLEENASVIFKVGDKSFNGTVFNDTTYFELDVPAGEYTVGVYYKDKIINEVPIKVLNQYSRSFFIVQGNNYAALVPIYNNETFTRLSNTTIYSELAENTRRYVFNTGYGLIVYNVTVSNTDELSKVIKKMARDDYFVDVTVINLKKGNYQITESGPYRDQEWNYLFHLKSGSLYINGNGATIDADLSNSNGLMTIESDCIVGIENLTIKKFKRGFVNNGELQCSNCNFIENNALFIATKTPGAVVYNKKQATFINCTFNENKNDIRAHTLDGEVVYLSDLQAVIYAEGGSLTNLVNCKFMTEHDTIRAVDQSMVVLYDDDKVNYNNFTKDFANTFEAGSCLDLRPISSFKVNKTVEYSFNDLGQLVNKMNNDFHSVNASSFVIDLENKVYTIDINNYKNIASPYDFRTYNHLHTATTIAGEKDNMNVYHKYLLEVGTRSVILNGHGATINLTGSLISNDNHFAFVPNYGSLTLINLTITGFNSPIVNYGNLIIINCTFYDNGIHYDLPSDLESEYGGVIRNYASAFAYNSTFDSNIATKGAVYFSSGDSAIGQFYNCTFNNNIIMSNLLWKNGDANTLFVNDNSIVKVIKCKGIGYSNVETDNGGLVLYRDDFNQTVCNLVVDDIFDLFRLSAIIKGNEKYDLINVTFLKGDYGVHLDSEALFEADYGQIFMTGNGARIFTYTSEYNDEMKFLKTTSRASVILVGLDIEGFNTAIENKGSLNIVNCILKDNRVDYVRKDDYGGAIVNEKGASLTIFNSSLRGNYAKLGGAIYNHAKALVIKSNFSDNYAYEDEKNLDIYNQESSITILCAENYPLVKDHFPMAAWKMDLIRTGVIAGITLVSGSISCGVSAAGVAAAEVINLVVGYSVGAIGGFIEAYIYANDHHDYSNFADTILKGMSRGTDALDFGDAIADIIKDGHISVKDFSDNDKVVKRAVNSVYTKFLDKSLDYVIGLIDRMTKEEYDGVINLIIG